MNINLQRLRADARLFKSTRVNSPIGKPKTGATAIIRSHFAEFKRLHSEEGLRWTEIASALSEQGVTQGDGKRITGRRLTALMRNIERQNEKEMNRNFLRAQRTDFTIQKSAYEKRKPIKLALAADLGSSNKIEQCDPIDEGDIRRNALERHAHLLKRP